MKSITAYKENGEYGFSVGHTSRENADDLYQTEVTDQDFEMMMAKEYKEKVKKLLDHRPFNNKK